MCVLDLPKRGAASAVRGQTGPFADHRCPHSAEIHAHVFCSKELYSVSPTRDHV